MAKQNLQMLEDLFCEESSRITQEINASMASPRVHYDNIESSDYDLEQATEALNRFMMRAQTQEQNSLIKKYNSIMEAPRAALWKNLPPHAQPPADAIRPTCGSQGNFPVPSGRIINSTTRNPVPGTSTGQNFGGPMGRNWQPPWGRGRGRGGFVLHTQNRVQKRNSTAQKDPKKTLRQMMEILLDQL